MKIKNSRTWAPNNPVIYGYALLGTLIAFLLRYLLHPLLENQFPTLFFLFNTIFISYKFGWKPALMSAILGVIIAFYFFIPPYNSFELPTKKDGLNLLFFSLLFITIIFLIEKLQRERFRAVLIARVSDSRMRIMAKLSSNKKNNLLY